MNPMTNNEEWKIEKRKPGCAGCQKSFGSEETHYSGIVEADGRFARRDYCLKCWESMKPGALPREGGTETARVEGLFSHWLTLAPKKDQRTLEDINAMQDFFKKLIAIPTEDPTREKVIYLTALLLMRKKRLKMAGPSKPRDGKNRLPLEKPWDGETVEIVDPPIADAELEQLKASMEMLFGSDLTAAPVEEPVSTDAPAAPPA